MSLTWCCQKLIQAYELIMVLPITQASVGAYYGVANKLLVV
jgi:hypothetical protein